MNKKARLGKGLDALLGGVDKIAAQSDGEPPLSTCCNDSPGAVSATDQYG